MTLTASKDNLSKMDFLFKNSELDASAIVGICLK